MDISSHERLTIYLVKQAQLFPFFTITSTEWLVIKQEKNVQNQIVFNQCLLSPQSEKINIL